MKRNIRAYISSSMTNRSCLSSRMMSTSMYSHYRSFSSYGPNFYSSSPSPPGMNPSDVPPPQTRASSPPSDIPESKKVPEPNVVPPAAHVGAGVDAKKLIYSKPSVEYPEGQYLLPHPLWTNEYVGKVEVKHHPRKSIKDWLAWGTIRFMRFNFDWMTGFMFKPHPSVSDWCTRVIFLETVAGVPGSVAGILRHLRSLRRMQRDYGWIHTLMEEAENERMHLMTFILLKKPGPFMRLVVLFTQGVFFNFYFIAYAISSTFCHRMVGYLEEEAVITYTKLLKQIDAGKLPEWRDLQAPDIARDYWKMDKTATMRDVIALIRADEAHHRDVNHELATLKPNMPNPFGPGH